MKKSKDAIELLLAVLTAEVLENATENSSNGVFKNIERSESLNLSEGADDAIQVKITVVAGSKNNEVFKAPHKKSKFQERLEIMAKERGYSLPKTT